MFGMGHEEFVMFGMGHEEFVMFGMGHEEFVMFGMGHEEFVMFGHEEFVDEFVVLLVAFGNDMFDIGTKIFIYVVHHYNRMLIFGWIGGIINAFHTLPQVVKIYRRKSINDISFYSLIIKLIAAVTYTIHGVIINDPPLLYMTGLMVAQYLFILGQYKYYYAGEECGANTVESDCPTTEMQNMQSVPPALSHQ